MSKLRMVIVGIILLFALFLKLHNYSVYPQRGASSDEYTYSFLGVSLLTKAVPISWSAFPAYGKVRHLTIKNLYFPIVSPYFDHPPLNGLLVGGFALIRGENSFEKIQLSTIRLVAIFLSIVSSVLLFLMSYKLYGYKTAVWALLIYSTSTLFVMNTRVVFAENLLTPLFLGTVYLFVRIRKHITYKHAFLIGLLCGLSFWTKELGISLLFSMIYLFVSEKVTFRKTLLMTITAITIVFLYVLYGAYFDFKLFIQVITAQGSRNVGPDTLLYITSTPIIVNKIYYDGWYFLGFLSLFYFLLGYAKNKMIVVPSFIYLLLLLFSLTQKGEMGWYLIPLFPYMTISSAHLIVESLKKQSWFIFVSLLFVGFLQIRYLYQANFGLTVLQFRVIMILLFAPFLILSAFNKEKLFHFLANTWFYFLIIGSSILTYSYMHPA